MLREVRGGPVGHVEDAQELALGSEAGSDERHQVLLHDLRDGRRRAAGVGQVVLDDDRALLFGGKPGRGRSDGDAQVAHGLSPEAHGSRHGQFVAVRREQGEHGDIGPEEFLGPLYHRL